MDKKFLEARSQQIQNSFDNAIKQRDAWNEELLRLQGENRLIEELKLIPDKEDKPKKGK